jgi:Ca-activated chloride channel family protein
MSFSWPLVLLSLLLIPLFVAVYVWLQRRKRRFAVRYASLSLIREALPRRSRWRRHVPFALYLLSLASLLVAASRPQAVVAVPTKRASIILAMDISLSMCSSDVPPNRLTVAEDVARRFIKDQPGDTRIGLVAFSGLAQLVVAPTTNRDDLLAAIKGFRAGRGTAIGSALLKSVDAIAEVNPGVARSGVDLGNATGGGAAPAGAGGAYEPDIIVLLTDGAATQGVDPMVAAQQAADRRVRVYTIGFGTTNPTPLACSPAQLGSDVLPGRFGGPGGPGATSPGGGPGRAPRSALLIDEETLAGIADLTGGTYYRAADAAELNKVFKELPNDVALQKEEREVSVAFVAIGALAAMLAVALSLVWNRYP